MSLTRRTNILLLALTVIIACSTLHSAKAQKAPKLAVIAYFMGKGPEADSYPVEKLTHIIYSFLHLEGNVLKDRESDSIAITHLVSLKQRNPGLKVILSLGGWGGCPTCTEVFATETGRQEFARSVKHLVAKYKADGLDLDWEYPAIASVPGFAYSPNDKGNITLLVKALRETLGKGYELSFAAGGFREFFVNSIEWDKVMPSLDYVNLMTYDLVNGYSSRTGHHTPLFSTPEQQGSVDYAIRFLDSLGVPKNKMVIGAAFYARILRNAKNENHGLYQDAEFAAYVNFHDFGSYFKAGSGFTYYWDDIAKAPYRYNAEKELFATFDDERSVELKTRYALSKQLGGIMFWSLNGDRFEHGLLDVIDKVKHENAPAFR